jgi:hypothetical protein
MSAYGTTPARSLQLGDSLVLSNAVLAAPYATQQFAVAPKEGESGVTLTFTNPTSVTATLYGASGPDLYANYDAVKDINTTNAVVIGANSNSTCRVGAGFYFLLLSASASTGVITVNR